MKLTQWQPEFHKDKPFAMAIAGSRRSGKSYLIRHMYNRYWKNMFHLVCVFSNSISSDFYAEFVHGDLQFAEFKPEVVEKIFAKQEELAMKGKQLRTLIIFDDCVSNRQKYNDEILQVFTRGRHSDISIVFASQTSTLIDGNWANNLDYLIVFRQRTYAKKEHIINAFLMGNADEAVSGKKENQFWNKLINDVCVNHQCLVLDYFVESNKFEDLAHVYKAN